MTYEKNVGWLRLLYFWLLIINNAVIQDPQLILGVIKLKFSGLIITVDNPNSFRAYVFW
jgi:hypothetical protein